MLSESVRPSVRPSVRLSLGGGAALAVGSRRRAALVDAATSGRGLQATGDATFISEHLSNLLLRERLIHSLPVMWYALYPLQREQEVAEVLRNQSYISGRLDTYGCGMKLGEWKEES